MSECDPQQQSVYLLQSLACEAETKRRQFGFVGAKAFLARVCRHVGCSCPDLYGGIVDPEGNPDEHAGLYIGATEDRAAVIAVQPQHYRRSVILHELAHHLCAEAGLSANQHDPLFVGVLLGLILKFGSCWSFGLKPELQTMLIDAQGYGVDYDLSLAKELFPWLDLTNSAPADAEKPQ